MKKIFFASLAVFAAVLFSAFIVPDQQPPEDEKANYIWYRVVYDVDHPDGYIPEGAEPEFVNVSKSSADAMDNCSGTTADCLRGFLSTPSLPTEDPGDEQTLRTAPF